MLRSFFRLLVWRGPRLFLCLVLPAALLWWLRRENPASWAFLVLESGDPVPRAEVLGGAEAGVLGVLCLGWIALLAHAFLGPGLVAQATGRRPRTSDTLGVMAPAAFLACTHFVWQALLASATAWAAIRVLGFEASMVRTLLLLFGLALIVQVGASGLVAQIGAFASRFRTVEVEGVPDERREPISGTWHAAAQACCLLPLAMAYFGLPLLLVETPLSRLVHRGGADAAFAVLGILELGVLVVWMTANVVIWRAHRGRVEALSAKDVKEVFA